MFASPDTSRRSFNGYHLLNEVSTGGTLSSLFSILTLFTEDIKLSWSPPESDSGDEREEEGEMDGDVTMRSNHLSDTGFRRTKSRANSDVSQMADETLGKRVSSPEDMSSELPADSNTEEMTGRQGEPRLRSVSSGTIHDHTRSDTDQTIGGSATADEKTPTPPTSRPSTSQAGWKGKEDVDPGPNSTAASPATSSRRRSSRSEPKSQSSREKPSRRPKHGNTGAKAFKGTIARATKDTTLAVIPAEAFRKLTRKFPKASGTVVQVVLERFSRVTFMTGTSLTLRH